MQYDKNTSPHQLWLKTASKVTASTLSADNYFSTSGNWPCHTA